MVAKPVAAFWMIVLYGASAYLCWSGIADSSLLWLGIATLCGFLGFGQCSNYSNGGHRANLQMSDALLYRVKRRSGWIKEVVRHFSKRSTTQISSHFVRKEHPEFAQFSNRDFIEYCEKWRKQKPEEFREMMKASEQRNEEPAGGVESLIVAKCADRDRRQGGDRRHRDQLRPPITADRNQLIGERSVSWSESITAEKADRF
jgi:ligand-binding sensor protein